MRPRRERLRRPDLLALAAGAARLPPRVAGAARMLPRVALAVRLLPLVAVTALLLPLAAGAAPSSPAPEGQDSAGEAGPVRLRLAISPSLRRLSQWSRRLTVVVGEASAILEPHLGRSLEVAGTVVWEEGMSDAAPETLLASLGRSVSRDGVEVVVGVAAAADYLGRLEGAIDDRGVASYREGYAVLALEGDLARAAPLLAHEVAHLFGAVHVGGADLLMRPVAHGRVVDPLTSRLLRLHRDRAWGGLRPPLDRSRQEEARELYRQAIAAGDGTAHADARRILARLDMETGRADRAVESLAGLVAADGGDLEARVLLVAALREADRFAEAVEAHAVAADRFPGSLRIHYQGGLALRAAGRAGDAADAFRRALDLDPGFTPAAAGLVEALVDTGRTAEARQVAVAAAAALEDPGPEDLALLAPAFLAVGDAATARALNERLVAGHPDSPVVLHTVGRLLESSGDLEAAAGAFRRAIEVDPRHLDGLMSLSRVLVELEDPAGAVDAARRAVEARPRSPAARQALARALLAAGLPWNAAAELDEARRLAPGRPELLAELGYAHMRAGDLAAARRFTEEALGLDRALAWAWVNLGVLSTRSGRPQAAEPHYRRALEIDPESVGAWSNLGHTLLAARRHDEARAAYERALALGSGDAAVLQGLATIHLRQGAFDSAWEMASRALAAGAELPAPMVVAIERGAGRPLPSRRRR